MSNENENKREQSDEDVLKALHGLGNSDETEVGGEEEHETHEMHEAEGKESEEGTPSPAASGFVGMLAKEGKAGGLDAGAKKAGSGDSGMPIKGPTAQIYMAREIQPVAGGGGGPTGRSAPRARVKQAPGWYHAAVPVMYTLGSLLLLIGLWSIGALIYMAIKTPTGPADVAYPFISPQENFETEVWGYTQGSRSMAWVMLASLPVSLALGMMAGIMRKHIQAENRSKEQAVEKTKAI